MPLDPTFGAKEETYVPHDAWQEAFVQRPDAFLFEERASNGDGV